MESHVYNTHIPLERSPFYCKLCTFRCTTQEDLERHVQNFGPHKTRENEYRETYKETDFDLEKSLLKSNNPYYVTAADMLCLSVEESEQVWQNRRRQTHIAASPAITTSLTTTLNTTSPIQRHVATPVQDENIWDIMMGPTQYSSNMIITPTRAGLQTAVSDPTPHAALTSAGAVTSMTSSGLSPAFNFSIDSSVPVNSMDVNTAINPWPPFNTLMSSAMRCISKTVLALSSPVLPSGYHPLYGTVIPTMSGLDNSALNLVPSMTLPRHTTATAPVLPTVVNRVDNSCLPSITSSPQSVTASATSSPMTTKTYNPIYPSFDRDLYKPTPIARSEKEQTTRRDDKQCQTDTIITMNDRKATCDSQEHIKAINDLNKTLHHSLNSISRAIENQTLLLGAIQQQINTYVRNSEDEQRKRPREEDTSERLNTRENLQRSIKSELKLEFVNDSDVTKYS